MMDTYRKIDRENNALQIQQFVYTEKCKKGILLELYTADIIPCYHYIRLKSQLFSIGNKNAIASIKISSIIT